MLGRTVCTFALTLAVTVSAAAQDVTEVELSIAPSEADSAKTSLRLLPADPELESGNAAIIMLRLIWEQSTFMEEVAPKIRDWIERPYDDPEMLAEFDFDGFQRELRRAAHQRTAVWEYPMEGKLYEVALPDVGGLLHIAGRGTSLWVAQRIVDGDYLTAIDGIQTQLACAKHISETPFVVTQLVGLSISDMAFDRIELLMSKSDSPNLYWALAMLPDSIGNTTASLQWEAAMLPRSLPTLGPVPPELTDQEAWKSVAAEFSDFMIMVMGNRLSQSEGAALQMRMLEAANAYLIKEREFTPAQLEELSSEAIIMRWVLALNQTLHQEIEAAYSLPGPQAIKALSNIGKRIEEIEGAVDVPASPLPADPVRLYLAMHRFERRVKIMQALEAIRHFCATNERLPASLDECELFVPDDPMTGKPFEYQVNKNKASLEMGLIEGLDETSQRRRAYRLSLATDESE